MGYAKKTLFGTIWNASLNIYNQAASFVVYALLARILLVEDFGLIAFCFLLTEMTVLFGNFGVNQILIQRARWSQKLASNCFWVLIVFSIFLGLAIALVAGPISNHFFYKGSWDFLLVLSFVPIFNSISLVSHARLMREFKFRKIAISNVISTSVGAVISIWGVLNGFGVWAVIWGRLIQSLTLTVLLVAVDRFIPSFTFSKKIFRVILNFGLPLFYQTIVHFVADRAVALAVAAMLGATQFAYIALAQRAFRMIRETSITPLNGILLSAFSRIDDKSKIEMNYSRVVRLASLIVLPLFIGSAAISSELIELAFGDNWEPSVLLFQLLCFTIVSNGLVWYIPQVLISIGRPDISFRLHLMTASVNVTFCLMGALHSSTGAVLGLLISAILLCPIKFMLLRPYVTLRLRPVFFAAFPSLSSALIMFVSINIFASFMGDYGTYLRLIIMISNGALVYILAYALFFKSAFKASLNEMKEMLSKKS